MHGTTVKIEYSCD